MTVWNQLPFLGAKSQLWMQKGITLLVLITFLFTNVGSFLPWENLAQLLELPKTEAATGDLAVYRNNSDKSQVTGATGLVKWDTAEQSAANINLLTDDASVDLTEGGKYLVLYNVWTEKGAGAGSDRRSFETALTVNGTEIPYGRAGSYFRDGGVNTEAYAAGGAIIDVTAGEDVAVSVRRDDTNTSAESHIRAGTNGLSILKLNNNFDYLRLQQQSDSTDISGNSTFTKVTFDTIDEVDTNSFAHSSGDITLKGPAGKKFMITSNVRLHHTSGGTTRQNYETRLALDSTEITGTRVGGYIRAQQGTDYTTLTYTGVIEKTTSADQTLSLQLRRESPTPATTVIVGGETAFSAAALPDVPGYIMLTNDADQSLTNTPSTFTWNEQVTLEGSTFSHSTTSQNSRITLNTAGNYLFFSTTYNSRTTGTDRISPRIDWRLDGSIDPKYGGHGSYNRGDQGVDDAFTSGSSGGLILPSVSGGQYLELLHSNETSGTPNNVFPANRIALQGIDLTALSSLDTVVSQFANVASTIAAASTGVILESIAITEKTSARNVTSLTFAETGSIDAAMKMDNIRVFYEYDTTAPYNCVGETYAGTENQFGSTRSGFTSGNGTVTFSDSVSVSPTAALCTYLLADIDAAVSDGTTINAQVGNPSTDVVVTGGASIGPGVTLGDTTVTTVTDPEITMANYHWRNDDGNESSATSATGGIENTPALAFSSSTPQRLRVSAYAAGTGEATMSLQLEYAEKTTSCALSTGWTDVGAGGGAWDMFDSANIVNGLDTTNISLASGGVTDSTAQFLTPNGGLLDTSSQTGPLTLGSGEQRSVGEVGTSTVTNGTAATINLDNTYTNPVVNVSVRYNRNSGTQRVARVVNKTATSFDVLVDNFDSSVTGVTVIDYIVMEAGEWNILNDAGATVQMYATSTEVSSGAVGTRFITSPPAGSSIITYPTSFSTQPTVLATVASNNDPDWLFASVYDGSSVTAPPSSTQVGVFLNENFESDGHTANETVDILVAEQVDGNYQGTEYRLFTSGSANVTNTPVNVTFSTLSQPPAVTIVTQLTTVGADGSYGMVDTGTAPTASSISIAIDEDGTGADRGHRGEEIGVMVFENSGRLYVNELVNREFVELEYSLQATANVVEGKSYCFRVSDAGTALRNYSNYPEAAVNGDVTVSASGAQVATVTAETSDNYLGGTFVITDNVATRDVTGVTITELGTVNASTSLANVLLRYDVDTAAPYDCASESYADTDSQYGTTVTGGFSESNGTASFTDSVSISTTSALCLYPVVDVNKASNGETVAFAIVNPASEVIVSGGSVGPGSQIDFTSSTTIQSAALTQTGYHWRNNDGAELDASSATAGNENTSLENVSLGSINRLRLAISNEGASASQSTEYQLEYGVKVTTCGAIASWQGVDTGAAFAMASTSQLVEGSDTTNIAVATGGVTDSNTTFLTPNGGQKEVTDTTGSFGLATTEFTELEYALQPTVNAGYATTYCFRVNTPDGTLDSYSEYAELSIQEQQDFLVQRGTEIVTGTSTTLVAGVDYTAPSNPTNAFIRITNSHMTGSGGSAGARDTPDDFTAYLRNPENISTSVTIDRPTTANDDTNVSWEIVEYIGIPSADNEMVVRDTGTITYGPNSLSATGSVVNGVVDDADVVVFITGQQNPDIGTSNYNTGLSVSDWDTLNSRPTFARDDADNTAVKLSYAVVEFTGRNWRVQRAEHVYNAAGVVETESIAAVNSLSQTFLHAQKTTGDELFNLDEDGHEVWLSSIGAVSFELQSGATNPAGHRSVAWVIENTQSGDGSMAVYRSNGTLSAALGAGNFNYSIGATVNTANSSIWFNNQSTGAGNYQPRGFLGASILNDTQYQLYRSDGNQSQDFRTEVVEWPTAELSITQNYYRLYVPNDTVKPTDAHPPGPSDLGENAAITDLTEPLGVGERVHIRMSLFINNANFVQNSKAFRLEYGRRISTCNAVVSWVPIGAPGSGEIWRGVDATPIDGSALTGGGLLLSVSDVPGTYEEQNNSSVNPNMVQIGEDVEYGWVVENNGGLQRSSYCFRMTEVSGAPLDAYDQYPTVKTSGYTPLSTAWRWYDDIDNETPNSPSAGLETGLSGTDIDDAFKLRIGAAEIEGATGANIKFNLQFSEYADFRDGGTTLAATSSCSGNSLWCYADGAADEDNDVIMNTVLPNIDTCVTGAGSGCGLHNESPGLTSPFTHDAFSRTEHEFTLKQNGARVNAVYYFRLIDATNGFPVTASSSYPSLQVSTSSLSFNVTGLPAGTTTAGITTDVATTPDNVSFAGLAIEEPRFAAHRLTVDTNATEGYKVLKAVSQYPTNSYGDTILPVTTNNSSPGAWATGCDLSLQAGCIGYHSTDATLENSSTRFSALDTYAGFSTTLEEIMYSPMPTTESHDIVYQVEVGIMQPAGEYVSDVTFVAVPVF